MPGKNERWARIDLSGKNGAATVHLEVGKHKLPVSHLVLQYGINQIPQAAVFVPLGSSVSSWEPSPAYAAIEELLSFTPATLRLTGSLGDAAVAGTASGERKRFPAGPAVLFVGYIRGVVYRRVHGQLGLIVNLSNQLIALTLSAAGSGDFVPGSPDDLFAPVLQVGTGGGISGVASGRFAQELNVRMPTDFSAAVLHCVETIATNSWIQTSDYDTHCAWPKISSAYNENTMALKALRANGDWRGIANFAFVETAYPLNLPEGWTRISAFIGERFAQSLASTNLWGMLAYAVIADFGMAIMPTATTAYLAPLLKVAKTPAYSIYPDEYADVTMTAGALLPLYGVSLVRQTSFGTYDFSQQGNSACVGAMFTRGSSGFGGNAVMKQPTDGMWMYLKAPGWLGDWPLARVDGVEPANQLHKTMSGPSTEVSSGVRDDVPVPPTSGDYDISAMLKLFAQMRYVENLYRGREGTVVGKLRFDIAPGTLLRVVGRTKDEAQRSPSEASDSLATDMLGCVSQVTIMINAQQATATTSFRLTDLRTAEENERREMALTSHPFFGENYFKHAPLVPELTPNA